MVELGLMVAGERLVRRKVDLAAKDGLDDQRRLELVDVALLVPHGHVLDVLGMLARVCLGVGLHQLVAAVLFKKALSWLHVLYSGVLWLTASQASARSGTPYM